MWRLFSSPDMIIQLVTPKPVVFETIWRSLRGVGEYFVTFWGYVNPFYDLIKFASFKRQVPYTALF